MLFDWLGRNNIGLAGIIFASLLYTLEQVRLSKKLSLGSIVYNTTQALLTGGMSYAAAVHLSPLDEPAAWGIAIVATFMGAPWIRRVGNVSIDFIRKKGE